MDVSIKFDCTTHVCRVCLKVLSKSCQFFRLNPVDLNTQPDATLRNKLCDCFPNLSITPDAILCEICAAEVDAAHKFKTKCLQTENMIDNYMKRLGKVASVDLGDVVHPSPEESCNVDRNYISSPDHCTQLLSVIVSSLDSSTVRREVELDTKLETTTIKTEVKFLDGFAEDDSVEMVVVELVGSTTVKAEVEVLEDNSVEIATVEQAQVATTTMKTEIEIHEWLFIINASYSDQQSKDNSVEMATVEQIPSNKPVVDSKVGKSAEYVDKKLQVVPSPATTNLTPFKCHCCAFTSIFQEAYIIHLRMHTGEKPFKCDKCYYSSAQRLNLTTHIKTHLKKCYQCDKCNYRTENENMFSEHMKNHPQKSYPCIYCNYRTTNQSGLTRHMKSHNDLFKCDSCPFSTNGKLAYIRHVNTHIKPFKCSLCNYKTSANHWFQMHIKKHSN